MHSKRRFIKLLVAGLVGFPLLRGVRASYKPKVVIIGGGFGGGTVLRYLQGFNLDLTLIEKDKSFYTCPLSNYVIGGFRKIHENKFDYRQIKNRGVNVIFENVKFIDSEKKKIHFQNNHINYDWLVLSPGIGFKWNSLRGFSQKLSQKYPIAWSGQRESEVLFKKIDSLGDNSKVIISAPDYPYRCPPAPYERASLIANYLQNKKKRFKIFIFDKKNSFTKMKLFLNSWNKLYPNSIEWIPRSKGGLITEFLEKESSIKLDSGEKIKGDFINIIPDQRCSDIIKNSRLTERDWCNVNPTTFEVLNHKNIHIIGDSIDAWDMPKSAFSASSQAKVCAENLKNIIFEKKIISPVFLNTCYSLAAKDYGFAISSWYKTNSDNTRIVSLGSKSSPIHASESIRKKEAKQSLEWYASITSEIFS